MVIHFRNIRVETYNRQLKSFFRLRNRNSFCSKLCTLCQWDTYILCMFSIFYFDSQINCYFIVLVCIMGWKQYKKRAWTCLSSKSCGDPRYHEASETDANLLFIFYEYFINCVYFAIGDLRVRNFQKFVPRFMCGNL